MHSKVSPLYDHSLLVRIEEAFMWNKEKPGSGERASMTAKVGNEENIIAFVGRGVEFKGAISYEGTVRIDGRVEGEIHTNGVLVVGEEAAIAAKITVGT